jgi:hypothetical protein
VDLADAQENASLGITCHRTVSLRSQISKDSQQVTCHQNVTIYAQNKALLPLEISFCFRDGAASDLTLPETRRPSRTRSRPPKPAKTVLGITLPPPRPHLEFPVTLPEEHTDPITECQCATCRPRPSWPISAAARASPRACRTDANIRAEEGGGKDLKQGITCPGHALPWSSRRTPARWRR